MATHDELLELLRGLEAELHQLETRRDPRRLGELLHPEFVEFGRSGRRYSRADVLAEFVDADDFPTIVGSTYQLRLVADNVGLLTYVSAHADASGDLTRHTLRSSLWVRGELGWQMLFHQGTPACEDDAT